MSTVDLDRFFKGGDNNMKRQKSGFTLVELLIVIALLGALAIGLIGALDPFEQLKKGTDTGTRDLVNQVQTAVLRYNATTNRIPWTNWETENLGPIQLSDASLDSAIQALMDSGEMKTNFNDIYANSKSKVWLTYLYPSTTQSLTVRVCYMPDSKSFQVEPNTKYNQDGTVQTGVGAAACKSVSGGGANCYWCVQ